MRPVLLRGVKPCKPSVLVVRLAIVAGVLAAWRAASTQEFIDELIFGKPSGVWDTSLEYLGSVDA